MVPLQLADDFGRVHRSDTRQPQDGAAHLARGSQLVLPRGRRLSAVRAVVAEPFGAAMAITRYQRRSRRLNDEQASHRLRLCTSTPPPPSDRSAGVLGAAYRLPAGVDSTVVGWEHPLSLFLAGVKGRRKMANYDFRYLPRASLPKGVCVSTTLRGVPVQKYSKARRKYHSSAQKLGTSV